MKIINTTFDAKSSLKEQLPMISVPPLLYIFYSPEDVVRIGTKLCERVYSLDNFLFVISQNQSKKMQCYYALEFLKKHPETLLQL